MKQQLTGPIHFSLRGAVIAASFHTIWVIPSPRNKLITMCLSLTGCRESPFVQVCYLTATFQSETSANVAVQPDSSQDCFTQPLLHLLPLSHRVHTHKMINYKKKCVYPIDAVSVFQAVKIKWHIWNALYDSTVLYYKFSSNGMKL